MQLQGGNPWALKRAPGFPPLLPAPEQIQNQMGACTLHLQVVYFTTSHSPQGTQAVRAQCNWSCTSLSHTARRAQANIWSIPCPMLGAQLAPTKSTTTQNPPCAQAPALPLALRPLMQHQVYSLCLGLGLARSALGKVYIIATTVYEHTQVCIPTYILYPL